MKILRISCVFGGFLFLVLSLSARTFNSLYSFDGTDGARPSAALIQATDGNFYGTAEEGGANGYGTVFKITPRGKLTTLYSFCSQNDCTDGNYPYAGLIQATDGNFYGTTVFGGTNFCKPGDCGTVFQITPSGKLTTLHSFDWTDGAWPYAGLVQATDGNFYGTAEGGGANGGGTIFKITPRGKLTTLYSFCSQSGCTDGGYPYAGVIQATDGNLYGTTSAGGVYNYGTVFKITTKGKLMTLYSFCSQGGSNCTDGANPWGGVVQATDGNLYGTTNHGGASGDNCACGTVFKITPKGTLTTLHSFSGPEGAFPEAGVVQATNGDFYGTTYYSSADGVVFKITPGGKLTRLHNFEGTDGAWPSAGLLQATNGTLYGTTSGGGADGDYGTVFSLSVGLGPFVETQPTSGKVGSAVKILGTDLTGATSVTFNGTAAVFEVVSASLIKTTVPEGATAGTVAVTTPKGTLNSNVVFRVKP